MSTTTFGQFLKALRVNRGVTLRDHCLSHGFDPGNYSRLERGLYPPPKQELLEKYARALGVLEGTDDWMEYFDLAAVAKGELPRDLLDDAAVVEKLPVLFRTLRGDRIPPEKLEQLIEMLRKG